MLHPTHLRIDDTTLSASLSELLQTRSGAVLKMRKLLELAGLALADDGEVTPAVSMQLAETLDRIGFALEPDYRYDGWWSGLDDEVVIFKAECGGPISPERPAYLETKEKIDAIALAAAVSRKAPNEGFESVKGEIAAVAGFSPVERARLLAYAFVSLVRPPKLKRKRVVRAKSTRSKSKPDSLAFPNMKFLPLAGAGVLFGFAIFLAHLAAQIDPAPDVLKTSAADKRHECFLITDPAFQAECLQHVERAEGGTRIVADSPKALSTIQ